MKKLICKYCKSEDIRIDVGHSAKFTIDENGYRGFEEDNLHESDIIGDAFCGDCGREFEQSNQ